ncbi:MAG: LON peptidase substrate-binding domain-containing protein, partial [Bdellovibrionales bacterium]|nr:LON peptidase substrate-binding domain-containing protein [Bdellovibrionales bacterium]
MTKRPQKAPKRPASPEPTDEHDQPEQLPLLPTPGLIPFPGAVFAIHVVEPPHIAAVQFAIQLNRTVAIAPVLDTVPSEADSSHTVGLLAHIVHAVRMPDGDYRLRLHVQSRVELVEVDETLGFPLATVRYDETPAIVELEGRSAALIEETKQKFEMLSQLEDGLEEHAAALAELFHPGVLADLVASALPLEYGD